MKHRFGLRIGDVLLMLFLLLLAVFLFFLPFMAQQAQNAEIVIAQTGEIRTVSLNTDATYEISSRGINLTVQVKDGTIFVAGADCRDGICRATLPISRAGQSIVCAPAGVVVRITGEEALVDGVSG